MSDYDEFDDGYDDPDDYDDFGDTEDDSTNIIILNDEDGNEVPFEFLDMVTYEDEDYVILLPADSNDEEDGSSAEVVILKLESVDGDEETYVNIHDQEVLRAVYDIFKEKNKDYFDFTD